MLSRRAPKSLAFFVFRAIHPSNTSLSPVKAYTQKNPTERGRKNTRDSVPAIRKNVTASAIFSLCLVKRSFFMVSFSACFLLPAMVNLNQYPCTRNQSQDTASDQQLLPVALWVWVGKDPFLLFSASILRNLLVSFLFLQYPSQSAGACCLCIWTDRHHLRPTGSWGCTAVLPGPLAPGP